MPTQEELTLLSEQTDKHINFQEEWSTKKALDPYVNSLPGKFCPAPFSSLYIQTNGNYRVCCVYQGIESGVMHEGNIKNSSLEEMWNTNNLRKLRQELIDGKESRGCIKCWKEEDAGGFSHRKHLIGKLGPFIPKMLEEYDHITGKMKTFRIRWLDILWSNICNFACSTCGPRFSNSWGKFAKKFLTEPVLKYGMGSGMGMHLEKEQTEKNDYIISSMHQDSNIIHDVLGMMPNLHEIHFNGGEPLMQSENYRIMQELIDKKYYKLRLWFHTNGTILNYKGQKVLDIWAKMPPECIKITNSCDGIGKIGEYVRYGWKESKWLKFAIEANRRGYGYSICYTVSLYNIDHWPDFINWILSKNILKHKDSFSTNLVMNNQINAQILDKETKNEISNKLEIFKNSLKEKDLKDKERFSLHDATSSLQKYINIDYNYPDISLHDARVYFYDYTIRLDKMRGTNFLETFPNLHRFYYICKEIYDTEMGKH